MEAGRRGRSPKDGGSREIANALSAVGNNWLRFSHRQSILSTTEGMEGFRPAIGAFWDRIMEHTDAFPSEFWELYLQSTLTALGEKCRLVCVGLTMRRMLAATAVRQRRPKLEGVDSSER